VQSAEGADEIRPYWHTKTSTYFTQWNEGPLLALKGASKANPKIEITDERPSWSFLRSSYPTPGSSKETESSALQIASVALGALLALFAAYQICRKLLICCLRNNSSLRIYIFRNQWLHLVQRYVINLDTTRNFPLGHIPSRPIVRAPQMHKVDRSLSTDGTTSDISSIEASSQSGRSAGE